MNKNMLNKEYKNVLRSTHLKIGFILLVVLLLLDAEPPWTAAPFPEGLLEFISADFWNTSMVALAMFSKSEYSSYKKINKIILIRIFTKKYTYPIFYASCTASYIVCALFDHQLQLQGRLSHSPLVHVLRNRKHLSVKYRFTIFLSKNQQWIQLVPVLFITDHQLLIQPEEGSDTSQFNLKRHHICSEVSVSSNTTDWSPCTDYRDRREFIFVGFWTCRMRLMRCLWGLSPSSLSSWRCG